METPIPSSRIELCLSPRPPATGYTQQRHIERLQERLGLVLMEKKERSRAGMEIVDLLQKGGGIGGQRSTWHGKKAGDDFYKMLVEAYELKQQELLAEANERIQEQDKLIDSYIQASTSRLLNGVGPAPEASGQDDGEMKRRVKEVEVDLQRLRAHAAELDNEAARLQEERRNLQACALRTWQAVCGAASSMQGAKGMHQPMPPLRSLTEEAAHTTLVPSEQSSQGGAINLACDQGDAQGSDDHCRGNPKAQGLYRLSFALLACSLTIRLAAEPIMHRFPATVLIQASRSHALVTLTPGVAAADAASRGPSKRTVQQAMPVITGFGLSLASECYQLEQQAIQSTERQSSKQCGNAPAQLFMQPWAAEQWSTREDFKAMSDLGGQRHPPTCWHVGCYIGENDDHHSQHHSAAGIVNPCMRLHQVPESPRSTGTVEAFNGDKHSAEEDQQRIGYLSQEGAESKTLRGLLGHQVMRLAADGLAGIAQQYVTDLGERGCCVCKVKAHEDDGSRQGCPREVKPGQQARQHAKGHELLTKSDAAQVADAIQLPVKEPLKPAAALVVREWHALLLGARAMQPRRWERPLVPTLAQLQSPHSRLQRRELPPVESQETKGVHRKSHKHGRSHSCEKLAKGYVALPRHTTAGGARYDGQSTAQLARRARKASTSGRWCCRSLNPILQRNTLQAEPGQPSSVVRAVTIRATRRFCGLPMGVAAEPMFALQQRKPPAFGEGLVQSRRYHRKGRMHTVAAPFAPPSAPLARAARAVCVTASGEDRGQLHGYTRAPAVWRPPGGKGHEEGLRRVAPLLAEEEQEGREDDAGGVVGEQGAAQAGEQADAAKQVPSSCARQGVGGRACEGPGPGLAGRGGEAGAAGRTAGAPGEGAREVAEEVGALQVGADEHGAEEQRQDGQ
eukprot:SM000256S08678  [mRNA]  locus=s256:173774:178390:+ [translate_table: standard]